MSRFCSNHPDEYVMPGSDKCGYCVKLEAGLIGHDPTRTTIWKTDPKRTGPKPIKTLADCVICGKLFARGNGRQKTCGDDYCKKEYHAQISREYMARRYERDHARQRQEVTA